MNIAQPQDRHDQRSSMMYRLKLFFWCRMMFMRTAIFALMPLLLSAVLLPAASASSFSSLSQNATKYMQSGASPSNSGNGGSLLGQLASGSSASNTAGNGSLLTQMASGSLGLGSIQNAAGILGYCYKNGYIAGPGQQVKNKLMSLVGGQTQVQQSSNYQNGLNGLLQGQSGQTFSLTSLKSMVGKRVCNFVLNQAESSFLGG